MSGINVQRYKNGDSRARRIFPSACKSTAETLYRKGEKCHEKIISLLFAALLVLTAFAACSHEEKKPNGESDSYPSYTVNADDMNKEYKLDDIADLSLISSVDSAAAHFQGKEIRNVTKDLKNPTLKRSFRRLKA